MKHILFAAVIMPFISFSQDSTVFKYIQTYKDLAIAEMRRVGIPASITLAQGIEESRAGTSVLAINAHNHFGIKCGNSWTGPYILHNDERKNEHFRVYDSDSLSYIDHSNFLRTRQNYQILFTYAITDYKSWAKGLKKAGYASDPAYAKNLIRNIEKYCLSEYDQSPEVVVQNN